MTVSPELDRRNGRVYLVNYLLIFLAAPGDVRGSHTGGAVQ